MRKKLLAWALVACMVIAMLPAALAADFTDVAEDAWYKESVDAVVEAGLMKGVSEGIFNPQGTVTRAEVVQVLYNMAGTPEDGETSFADAAGRWYAPAAAWAEAEAIVDAGDEFRGGEAATRAEIADMLYRYAKFAHLPCGMSSDVASAAPDAADIPEEAQAGISWCVDIGIIGGDTDGNLKPNDSATRAEFAKLLTAFSALEVVPMAEYLEAHKDEFFLTGKTEYTVQARMVSEETHIHNDLEDVDYTVTDDGESVVLTGTVGEEWVNKLEKVAKTYTKADGSVLTAEDFAQRDTNIELKTKAEPDTNYACYVPADVAVQIDTSWGDVLFANRTGVPHGTGDYLICAMTEDGQPNFEDVWVVNGLQFLTNYDTTNAPAMGTATEAEQEG